MRTRLVAVVVFALCALAPSAWAHVAVSPDQAAKGATSTFSFRVPNEEAPAKTTSIEILWPDDVTFDRVEPVDKAGWTTSRTPRSVKWSGGAIGGEEAESFDVTLGPLPNAESITFKALQSYDDGQIVRWIGAEKTDNPAPVVSLTGAAVPTTIVKATTSIPVPTTDGDGGDGGADGGDGDGGAPVTALIAGAFALAGIGGGIAVAARRRPPQP